MEHLELTWRVVGQPYLVALRRQSEQSIAGHSDGCALMKGQELVCHVRFGSSMFEKMHWRGRKYSGWRILNRPGEFKNGNSR